MSPCDVCGHLDSLDQDSLTLTTAAIVQSAIRGCQVCDILKNSIAHARADFIHEVTSIKAKRQKDGPLELTYTPNGSPTYETLEIYSHADNPTSYSWAGTSAEVSLDSSSESCFDLIRSWINDCVTNHTSCPIERFPPLPTRVVDVGSDTVPPRLHVATPDQRTEYLALSHCWGPPAKAAGTIKTTAATLQDFQTEIPWTNLTKTFRDAITITRRLNFRYLWIDSLCIIQGDAHDWAVEASRMTTVYTNAFLVIAASGAPDGDAGCFLADRSASSQGVLRLPCPGPDAANRKSSEVYVRRSRRGIYFTLAEMRGGEYPHGWASAMGQPLDGRAWTYQEEELATRILLYTEDELQWRCGGANACECRPPRKSAASGSLRLGLGQFAVSAGGNPSTSSAVSDTKPQQRHGSVKAWLFMVSEYTRRDISYASDRLPGLSGIAGCWERATGDRYFAGLWERDLPRHLLWWAHIGGLAALAAPDRGSFRHAGYHAPTWSWASVTGAAQYIRDAGEVRVRVVDVQTRPATANRFGPVSSGNLVLSGVLVPVELDRQGPYNPITSRNLIRAVDAQGKTVFGTIIADVQTTEAGETEINVGERHYVLPIAGSAQVWCALVLRRSRVSDLAFERVAFLQAVATFPAGLLEREVNIL